MSKVIDITGRLQGDALTRTETAFTEYTQSLAKYINTEGILLDTTLFDRLTIAKEKQWGYIMYFGLLSRDKESLTDSGFIVEDLGAAYKISFPKETLDE